MIKKAGYYIGDRNFYRLVFQVAMPLMLQFAITMFVNMLDNVMIGQVGTLEMSGVSIVNQLLMILNQAVFGSVTAAGIFGAQFYGKGDYDGVQGCFYLKLILAMGCCFLGILVFGLFGTDLIGYYLSSSANSAENVAETMDFGWTYMKIMLVGLVPYALSQSLASTIKESGKTVLPMAAGFAAVLTNFVLNYILIFGNFGMPVMGVAGAAIATVISRFVELAIIVFGTLPRTKVYPFLKGVLTNGKIPKGLTADVIRRGLPLLLNEVFWSAGLALISQCYSTRGLTAVAAINIVTTIYNLFHVICVAMGNTIGILVGQKLGTGDLKTARQMNAQLMFFSIVLTALGGVVLYACAGLFPQLYNTTGEVRELAADLLRIVAVMQPVQSLYTNSYFTLRSGGKTFITTLFDSGFTCCVSFPVAFLLAHMTALPLLIVYLAVQLADGVKALLGLYLVKKGVWLNVLIKEKN